MNNPITAWSYSRLLCYEECPFHFKLRYIDKLPEPVGEPLVRGDRIHKGFQALLTGQPVVEKGVTYTADLAFEAKQFHKFEGLVAQLKANAPMVEQQWAFTRDMKPTQWFGKDVYYRCSLDAGVLWADGYFSGVDFKTGKPRDYNEEQMEQYAWSVFRRFNYVHTVETVLAYVDEGKENRLEFNRSQAPELEEKWTGRAAPMFEDKRFIPRPGKACRFCHYRKSNGGPCEYS